MQCENIFLKVLTQYFLEVLNVERENSKINNYHIPMDNIFFYLNDLDFYFKESELLRICDQYFTKINKKIKNKVLQKHPNLKIYFKEHFWKKPKPYSLKTTNTHYLPNLPLTDTNQVIFSETLHNPQPSTSGYRSPGTQSYQNSPVGSRCNSPLPEENTFSKNFQYAPVESRAGSPAPEDNIPFDQGILSSVNCSITHENKSRKQNNASKQSRYNLRQERRTKNFTRQNKVPYKRICRKRLKLFPYLNQLPDKLPSLKPNESILLLQARDGSNLDDLNVPLPICKTIFKQCRKINPVTKRYSAYEEDGSENIPLHITLKY